MFSQRAQNCLFAIRILNKTCVFFSFCFFALLDMVRVHAKAGPWGRPHAAYLIRSFERTFLRWKKTLLSKGTLEICTRARPKTLPKKVPKNSFWGLFWAKNTETGPKNEKVCNLQKLFLRKEGTKKVASWEAPWAAGARETTKETFCEKNVFFFFKNVCFSV